MCPLQWHCSLFCGVTVSTTKGQLGSCRLGTLASDLLVRECPIAKSRVTALHRPGRPLRAPDRYKRPVNRDLPNFSWFRVLDCCWGRSHVCHQFSDRVGAVDGSCRGTLL